MTESDTENKEMFAAGVHFGYSRSRRHPSTLSAVFSTRNGNDVIDLEQTKTQLQTAVTFLSELAKNGKQVLFVGTKPEAQRIVKDAAESINQPFVTERWVGGTLTNFSEIKKRVAHLVSLKEDREKGALDKYTKKERLLIGQDIEKMEKLFSGLVSMPELPHALVIVDSKKEDIAVQEAQKKNIPIVALCNTDCNIEAVTYPIIGNDASRSSISLIIKELKTGYENAQQKASN